MKNTFINFTLFLFGTGLSFSQGFMQSSVNWALPPGGHITSVGDYSFYNTDYPYTDGSSDVDGAQTWATLDINGDSKLDLIVLQQKQGGTYAVPGSGTNRYWKVYLNTGSGFSSSAINWSLPQGGDMRSSGNYNFCRIQKDYTSIDDIDGSQLWTTMDINGDSKPDLVVYRQQSAGVNNVPGSGTNRYWKVYLNTGTGFSTSAVNWILPQGGRKGTSGPDSYFELNHNYISSSDTVGSEFWFTFDINGDAKPDLVATRYYSSLGYDVLGPQNGTRYWKVYLNNGSGFTQTGINWNLPAGGNITSNNNNSFYDLQYEYINNNELDGSQLWSTMDMNGDAKPDLIVCQQRQVGTFSVPGSGNSKYWKVYFNTGTGFTSTAVNWALPPGGGLITSSFNYSYMRMNYPFNDGSNTLDGSQVWATLDINGDSKPDLVAYQQKQSDVYSVPGSGSNRYWKVYLNSGNGFTSTALNWSLPQGGRVTSQGNYSYDLLQSPYTDGFFDIDGAQTWQVMDINGDSKLDLVALQQKQSGSYNVLGASGNRYWKAYLNSATLGNEEMAPNGLGMAVYPNPFSDNAKVSFSHELTNANIKIYDLLGKEIRSEAFSGSEFNIEKTGMTAGVYLVKVTDGNQHSQCTKIVVR